MKLSIVTTLYRSENFVEEFYSRAVAAATDMVGDDYEIIMVNDGSPDSALEKAIHLTRKNSRLKILDLSRNFGHHKAMMTGLGHASGDRVFLIDCDLEEEPSWLKDFWAMLDEKKCDVVYGVQEKRKGGLIERASGLLFYWVFNALAGIKLSQNVVTARLMTRRYLESLLLHKERQLMIAGLWLITGYDQVPITVKKLSTSPTTYTWPMKIDHLVNAITSFSNKPLYLIFYTGITILLLSIIYFAYLVYLYFSQATPPPGWTSVMASTWILGGIVISFIGIVAIYISIIFTETKQRPYSIIRQEYQDPESTAKKE